MKESSVPYRRTKSRYGDNRDALSESNIRNLEQIGAVWQRTCATSTSALPQAGSKQFQFRMALKCIYWRTVPLQNRLAHLESTAQKFSSIKCLLDSTSTIQIEVRIENKVPPYRRITISYSVYLRQHNHFGEEDNVYMFSPKTWKSSYK